jgi:plasmid stabilization system protein ParE
MGASYCSSAKSEVMARVRFTASAEKDLIDLWLFIAENNPPAADNTVDSIHRSAQLLAEQPMMGRARPELAAGLRSFPTQTPYILFHFPDEAGGIIVARVLHHARDVEAIERWPATPR